MRRARLLFGTALFFALSLSTLAPVRADEEPVEPAAPTAGPWEEVVFLPEAALSVLLERDPRGVLLDRSSYLDLYRRARAASGDTPPSSLRPARGGPLRLLLCDATGAVSGDTARLRVRLSVSSSDDGRNALSLRLGGSVTSATLDGAAATLGALPDGALSLSVSGRGLHEALLEVVAPVARVQGRRSVAVALPLAPASRWRLDIEGRATASADEGLWRSERLSGPDRTRLSCFGSNALRASWSEGDQGTDLPPLVRATVHTLDEVGERSLDVTALVRIYCARSPQAEFALDLPEGLTVLGTDGASLRPAGAAAAGRVPYRLQFAEAFTGSATVMLRAARALSGPGETALPVIGMPSAATLDRRVAVRFKDGLRGFVTPGADAVRLDAALSEQGAVDALLRLDGDAHPTARSERPAVELRADVRALLDLADDGPWLALSFLYRPRGDRLYGVDPLLPAGFLPERIELAPAREFLRGTTPDGRLSLVFPGGVEAGGAVTVTLKGRWPVPGWTDDAWSEGGDAREATLPRFDAGTAVESEGYLGVSVPAGVEVRDEDSSGLTPAPVSELRERGGFSAEGLTLGWLLRGPAPGGRLRVTRPPASVSASVALLATPAEDHVTFSGLVSLAVQRSGVREVRLSVAPALGDALRIEGPDVAERKRASVEGGEIWTVRFTRLVRDGATLWLHADLPLAADAAAVTVVRVEGAARQELRVGVAAAGELEVSTEATGLTDADAADFPTALGAPASGLLRAWSAERDASPTLTVRAVRLAASPLPATYADSVRLRTVLGMDGIARTRVDAQIRNIDRQALAVVLPAGASLSSARVAGEAVRPVRTPAGALLVPIVPSLQPFPVVIVYEQPYEDTASAASLTAPDLGIPGSVAVWTVYLPEGALPVEATGEFAAPPARPGTPLLLRVFGSGASVAMKGAAGSASARAPRPAAVAPETAESKPIEEMDRDMEEEAPAQDDVSPDSRAPSDPNAPGDRVARSKGFEFQDDGRSAGRRIEARAAQRGLFGMEIRLLAAGPSVTATRLGPTGTLEVSWRSAAGRTAALIVCALLALIGGLLSRRRGLGAPTWTLLVLATMTTLPIVFGVVDTAPFDGAVLGTLCYAALAFLRTTGRGVAHLFRSRAPLAPAAALLLLALAAPAAAQDKRPAPPAPGSPAPDAVYVPYDPARPETLRTPERVFLPYERYRELWNRAHPEERIESAAPPVLVAAVYEGTVVGHVLTVRARYEIDPADGGLVALPPGAAVEDVRLGAEPVATTSQAPGGATLVPVPKGAPGARVTLTATLRWPVAGQGDSGAVRAPLPRVPDAQLTLDVPLADAVVSVAAEGGHTTSALHGATHISAALGPVGQLDLSWRPRGADAAGGRTRYDVDTEAVATLLPGRIDWSAEVVLRVSAGTVQELDALVPAALEIQSVEGPAVASWTVTDGTSLRLRLLGVSSGETRLSLRGLVRRGTEAGAVDVPVLSVPAASSDHLRVTVSAAGERLAVESSPGMERTDAPKGAAADAVAFRRVAGDGTLAVRTEALPGGLAVASRQHLHLGAEASLLRADLDLTPGPQGLYEVRVALPSGWTLDDSAGAATFAADGAVRLVFAGKPGATRTVTLRLRGPAAGADPFAVPLLRVDGAAREATDVLVSTAPGSAVTVASAEGADAVPAERFAGWPALATVELRSLAWSAPRGGAVLSVRRETLRSQSRPTVIADVTLLDDRVIVDALVQFDVRGGPERVFRVDAPAGVTDPWVLGEGLREVRHETVDGRERLTVTLQAAATGAVAFRVLYELPVPAGGEVTVAGPEPVGGEGARAFLMLRALGDAEVRLSEAPTLETCDVADLPLIPQGLDPVRVLRFLRARDTAWRLPLRLAAHELGELPEARAHLVEATTVVDRDGSARTRLLVRIFNRARGFLPVALPAGAALEAVIVAGTPVRPVTRPSEPGVVQVPLRVQSLGEESPVVSITYRTPPVTPLSRFDEIEPRLPEFPGVPVDATTWRLLLPDDVDYAFDGNLDLVEEVDVAFARADAYASDVTRLLSVYERGTRKQQTVAAQNLLSNSRELQQTLDVARERMADLEQAAAEGRVDPARVAQSRRKAEELAKNIDDVLRDVEKSRAGIGDVTADGAVLKDARVADHNESDQETTTQLDRYATKEGQAGKKWGANSFAQGPDQSRTVPQGAAGTFRIVPTLDQENAQSESVALLAQDGFDTGVGSGARRGLGYLGGDVDGAKAPGQPRKPDQSGADGPATGGGVAHDAGRLGSDHFEYGTGGGGGGGGSRIPGARSVAPPVAGLVSLEPPLVERGRSYAFRKLDAGAVITVSTRTEGIWRRGLAGLVLAGVVLLVWFRMVRSARRRAVT